MNYGYNGYSAIPTHVEGRMAFVFNRLAQLVLDMGRFYATQNYASYAETHQKVIQTVTQLKILFEEILEKRDKEFWRRYFESIHLKIIRFTNTYEDTHLMLVSESLSHMAEIWKRQLRKTSEAEKAPPLTGMMV